MYCYLTTRGRRERKRISEPLHLCSSPDEAQHILASALGKRGAYAVDSIVLILKADEVQFAGLDRWGMHQGLRLAAIKH